MAKSNANVFEVSMIQRNGWLATTDKTGNPGLQ
jgi:hypothetical protein